MFENFLDSSINYLLEGISSHLFKIRLHLKLQAKKQQNIVEIDRNMYTLFKFQRVKVFLSRI